MKIAICWSSCAGADAVQKHTAYSALALAPHLINFHQTQKDVWIRSSLVYMKDVIIQCDVNNLLNSFVL